jgi:hypothetical protein
MSLVLLWTLPMRQIATFHASFAHSIRKTYLQTAKKTRRIIDVPSVI